MQRMLEGLADMPEDIVKLIVQRLRGAIFRARVRLEIMSDPAARLEMRQDLLDTPALRRIFGFDFNP